MSSHQEKSNETMTPVPDITTVSDGEDEEVVNLEAIARLAKAKLDQDLVDARAWNEGITWKKQEWVDRLRKKKEDEDAAEAQWKLDEAAKAAKKLLVQPPVSWFACLLGAGSYLGFQTGPVVPPKSMMAGLSKRKVSGRKVF